jgi:hypothetical protein
MENEGGLSTIVEIVEIVEIASDDFIMTDDGCLYNCLHSDGSWLHVGEKTLKDKYPGLFDAAMGEVHDTQVTYGCYEETDIPGFDWYDYICS